MLRLRVILGLIFGLTGAAYAVLVGAAFFGQRSLMYPMPRDPIEPRAEGATLERIAGADGGTVYALHARAPDGAPTVVHFHGNGEDLAGQAALIRALSGAGIGTYAVEYPGYGLASGAALGEEALYTAAETALRHLVDELGAPPESLVLQGQSLGTGVAVEMAKRGYGARLILISPFTSMVDMAARLAPFLPARWLVRDRYESASKLPALLLPALVIHGTEDELVPFEMGRRVAGLLPRGELVAIEGGHHADLFFRDGGLTAKIAAFARRTER